MLCVVKVRKLDGQLVPLGAFAYRLSVELHHEVLHVEAGTVDATVQHHGSPSLQQESD